MPQQLKVTRKLNLDKRARIVGFKIVPKAANYSIDGANDGGVIFKAAHVNAAHKLYFFLPTAAACNGNYFDFLNTSGAMYVGTFEGGNPNSLIGRGNLSANYVSYALAGTNIGGACRILSDGVNYYHQHLGPVYAVINTSDEPYALG